MVDTIPLNEIISVSEMKDETVSLRSLKGSSSVLLRSASVISDRVLMDQLDIKETLERKSATAAKAHRPNILQIKTAPDGFNFGRTYYLKASIDVPGQGQVIVTDLSQAAKLAKARMDRKSRFLRSQEIVRYFQESLVFQIIVAFLILLVRSADVPHPPPPLSHP